MDFWAVGISGELDAIVVSFSGTNTSSVLSTSNNAQAQLVTLDSSLAPLANRTSGKPLVHAGYQVPTVAGRKLITANCLTNA